MKLAGKKAIITGSNQGFGLAVAKAFIQQGADVTLCARNMQTLQEAQKELEMLVTHQNKIIAVKTDVANPKEVERLVQTAIEKMGGLDILVSNAGIYGPKGGIEEVDWQAWSDAIDINLKGTVLACKTVLPHLKKQGAGKIIILSGGGATKPMPNLSAYAASKAGVVRFAETLAEEVKNYGIDVNSLAPGALNTRFLEEALAAGPEKIGAEFYAQAIKQKETGGTPLELGASVCVYLASAESNGLTGRLISALWDPWQSFGKLKDDLAKSDIYTLRRIVPADRGKNWD